MAELSIEEKFREYAGDDKDPETISQEELAVIIQKLFRKDKAKYADIAEFFDIETDEVQAYVKRGDAINRAAKKKETSKPAPARTYEPPTQEKPQETVVEPDIKDPEERTVEIAEEILAGSKGIDDSTKEIIMGWIKEMPNSVEPNAFMWLLRTMGVSNKVSEIIASKLQTKLELERRRDEYFNRFLQQIQVPRATQGGMINIFRNNNPSGAYDPWGYPIQQQQQNPPMNPNPHSNPPDPYGYNPYGQYGPPPNPYQQQPPQGLYPPQPYYPPVERPRPEERKEKEKDKGLSAEDVMKIIEKKEEERRKKEAEEKEQNELHQALNGIAEALKGMNEKVATLEAEVKEVKTTPKQPETPQKDPFDDFMNKMQQWKQMEESAKEDTETKVLRTLGPVLNKFAEGSGKNMGEIKNEWDLEFKKFELEKDKRKMELGEYKDMVNDGLGKLKDVLGEIGEGVGRGIAIGGMPQGQPQQAMKHGDTLRIICPNCGTENTVPSNQDQNVCFSCGTLFSISEILHRVPPRDEDLAELEETPPESATDTTESIDKFSTNATESEEPGEEGEVEEEKEEGSE